MGTRTSIDTILALILILVVPALALWRDQTGAREARIVRYRRATVTILACLAMLAVVWIGAGRSAGALGPPVPPSRLGWSCLGAALALLAVLGGVIRRRPGDGRADDVLPRTHGERHAFLLFALLAGTGWEILYRGFLLWFLSPAMGVPVAVIVASLSYGLAHGVRDRRKAIGSILSALLFTSGYALTRELWWLMLIHTGLPLFALTAVPPSADVRTERPSCTG